MQVDGPGGRSKLVSTRIYRWRCDRALSNRRGCRQSTKRLRIVFRSFDLTATSNLPRGYLSILTFLLSLFLLTTSFHSNLPLLHAFALRFASLFDSLSSFLDTSSASPPRKSLSPRVCEMLTGKIFFQRRRDRFFPPC